MATYKNTTQSLVDAYIGFFDDQVKMADYYQSLKEQARDMTCIRDRSVVEDKVEGMRIIRLTNPADLVLVAIRP